MTANRDISKLTPEFQIKVNLFLEEAGNEIFITEGWRSQERQNELYAQGRTKPGQIVTWTLNSDHTKGIAIDIAFNGAELYPSDINKWKRISGIAKKYGILWGYEEWGFDMPHFFDNGIPYKKELPKYFLDNYRGIPVVTSDTMCSKGANGCVFTGFEKIFITSQGLAQEEFFTELTLEHEYNHIIFNRSTKTEQDIFKKLHEISGPGDFITSYAKSNYKEDFADTGKIIFAREIMKQDIKESRIIELKKQYNRFLYNKYKG